jgi:hypothetical protein
MRYECCTTDIYILAVSHQIPSLHISYDSEKTLQFTGEARLNSTLAIEEAGIPTASRRSDIIFNPEAGDITVCGIYIRVHTTLQR